MVSLGTVCNGRNPQARQRKSLGIINYAPIINELPVSIECKVVKIEEEFNENRVVAEIVGLVADESVLTDGKVDFDKLHLVVFDTVSLCYREVGASVGGAWGAGKKFLA